MITIESINLKMIPKLRSMLKDESNIDFLSWETDEIISEIISQHEVVCKMAYDRDHNKIVGFILAGSTGLRGMLHHLYVLPEYRKRGIAYHLILSSLSGFQKLKSPVKRVFGLVYGSNKMSVHLLKKCGFILNPVLDKNYPFVVPMYIDLTF